MATGCHLLILTGGEPHAAYATVRPPPGAFTIAADSGLALAAALGLRVDLVVGDMDSVEPELLDAAERAGAQVQRHPAAKDATDLALALDAALERAPADLTVIGGHGGRLDHHLAGALVLAAERYAPLSIVAHLGGAAVTVVRDRAALLGQRGDVVSLLPAHGTAWGVRTQGLLFPLAGEDLEAGSTRGISNELTGERAWVTLAAGTLLAIQPGEPGPFHGGAP